MINKIYNKKIVMLFLVFLPIVEFITSITLTYTNINITFGMIYKTIFIIYSLVYLLFYNKQDKKYNLILILAVIIYSIFHFLTTVPEYTINNIFKNLINISRYISFPISVLFFYSFNKKNKISLKTINYSALLYGLVMFIATSTSTAFATYDSIGIEKGQSGWYISGNELSNLLSIFLPISLYYFVKNNKPMSYVSTIFITFGLLIIGTKTSLVGLILGSISLILYLLIVYVVKNEKKTKIILSKLCIYLFIVIVLIPFTPAFKFMKERYFNSFNVICNNETCDESLKNGLDKFIYNGREIDLKNQKEIFLKANLMQKLFGLNDNQKNLTKDGQYNIIEQDFYDILFIYGIIGFIIFFIPMLAVILEFLKELLFNFRNTIGLYKVTIGISILLAVGISYIAGHVFLASTVGIIISFIISNLVINDSNKKSIIIYMPKLSIGGMEKALINMINISNTLKEYDVTLVLGYYTDKKFLSMIPENIKFRILCNRKWDNKGKIEAGINYIAELFYALSINFDYSICYSYHHKVLSVLSRLASKNSMLFMHTDLINSRTKDEIDSLNKKVQFQKFKGVVCVSEAALNSFNKLYPNYNGKLVCINNFIDGDTIINMSNLNINDIKFDKSITSFINISRHFERAKKITRIIEASSKLKEEGYSFKVYLVGDGEDHNLYIELINKLNLEQNVIMLGSKINPYNYLKNCNSVIISSDFEGYGIVIDEARVLNIPIITTDIADAKNIITNDIGIIVNKSSDGIYDGMRQVLDNNHIKFNYNFDYNKFNQSIDDKFNDFLKSFVEE